MFTYLFDLNAFLERCKILNFVIMIEKVRCVILEIIGQARTANFRRANIFAGFCILMELYEAIRTGEKKSRENTSAHNLCFATDITVPRRDFNSSEYFVYYGVIYF